MDLPHPPFTLDPFAADARAEAERLLEAGPVVPVDVVGVPVRAVTRHAVAQQISEDPSFSTDSGNRGAPQRGEVPAGRRLRDPVSRAFTARRVEALGPRLQRIVDDLLERLAATPAHEATDRKEAFAVPLRSLCHALLDTTEQPTRVTATEEALHGFMAEPAASKAADPGDDLTSMPVEHHTGGSITHDELIDTLIPVLTAGHQTTIDSFTNSLLALMTYPEQLARVRAGEPVMMSYVSLGHDPAQHGPPAAWFDVALPAFFDRFDAEPAVPRDEAEAAAQLAAQPHGQGLHRCGTRRRGPGVPGPRTDRRHGRGLRTPRARRGRAPPARLGPRHAGARPGGPVRGQDVRRTNPLT